MKFNLNCEATVHLTNHGLKILQQYYDNTYKFFTKEKPKLEKIRKLFNITKLEYRFDIIKNKNINKNKKEK